MFLRSLNFCSVSAETQCDRWQRWTLGTLSVSGTNTNHDRTDRHDGDQRGPEPWGCTMSAPRLGAKVWIEGPSARIEIIAMRYYEEHLRVVCVRVRVLEMRAAECIGMQQTWGRGPYNPACVCLGWARQNRWTRKSFWMQSGIVSMKKKKKSRLWQSQLSGSCPPEVWDLERKAAWLCSTAFCYGGDINAWE